jgi:hypothetical protein
MSRKAIGNLIKQGLRKAYKGKTAPLQALSKGASRIAPDSKMAAMLAAAASPSILNPSSGKKAPPKKVKEKAPTKAPEKRVQGNAAKRGTYTARKRTGSKIGRVGKRNSPGNAIDPSFDFNIPGQDISPASMRRGPIRRMKGGGLAMKGQGKAFIKSKK